MKLRKDHLQHLLDSGISSEVIVGRGYFTATKASDLRGTGLSILQSKQVPGICMPIHHVSRQVKRRDPRVANVVYRPDRPRLDANGKPLKYEAPAGRKQCLDLHPRHLPHLKNPLIPLWITEGLKKADAATSRGLFCIALLGVWNWDVHDWDFVELRHRQVYIAFDSDWRTNPHVREAMKRLIRFLQSRGATVVRIYLPCGPRGEKVGLDDYFAAGGTVEELATLIKPPTHSREPGDIQEDRPTIELQNRQLDAVIEESLAALRHANQPERIFQMAGSLVRLIERESEFGVRPVLQRLDRAAMQHELSLAANFTNTTSKGRVSQAPPMPHAQVLLSLPEWPGVPVLSRLVETPFLGPDGSLCESPGYYPKAQTYYYASHPVKLPDTSPTTARIKRARKLLLNELLGDFPFADTSSKAHAVALILLPFVRSIIEGPTPIFWIDAPTPGTGKTLFAECCALVSCPSSVGLMTAPKNEEEYRKKITTLLREGRSHAIFDNVTTLGSESLQAAVTAPDMEWVDRALGGNETVRCPIRCVWVVTANNLTAKLEDLRRCLPIRLDARTDRPESRSDFRHPHLLTWVKQNRHKLIGASLTLIRAWLEAGRPDPKQDIAMGSFEAFIEVMGGILDVSEVPGFLGNMDQYRTLADDEGRLMREFIRAWWDSYAAKAVGASALRTIALRFFEEELGTGSNQSQVIRLGKMLGKLRDNVVDGKRIVFRSKGNSVAYYLQPIQCEG